MKRYIWLLILAVVIIAYIWIIFPSLFPQYLATLLMAVFAELVAIALSEFALFAFTKIPFTKILAEGANGQLEWYERKEILRVAGMIFIGVHILVAICIGGLYFAQFN